MKYEVFFFERAPAETTCLPPNRQLPLLGMLALAASLLSDSNCCHPDFVQRQRTRSPPILSWPRSWTDFGALSQR